MEYSVKDLALASMLHMDGHKIVRVDIDRRNMAVVIFDDSADLRGEVDKFYHKEALVEPKKFSIALKEVKQMVWEKKNG